MHVKTPFGQKGHAKQSPKNYLKYLMILYKVSDEGILLNISIPNEHISVLNSISQIEECLIPYENKYTL